jgi:cell wall-associated NlpC family hydrolase
VTAPAAAVPGIGTINADLTAVQARISSINAAGSGAVSPADTAASTTASTAATTAATTPASDSADRFAAALSQATGTRAPASAYPASQANGSAVSGTQVVADAKKYLGVPYVWGGESTSGIDCSGLVQRTYHDLGIDLPRVAADQQKVGTSVPSLTDAQPGDLLFFGQPAYHVAIYLGNNQLIESPEPGKTVHITDVYKTPSSIRRIVPAAGAEPASPTLAGGSVTAGGLSAGALTAAGLNRQVAGYAPQFAAAEAQYHLPAGMLAAVAQQESGGNARAVSPAGAEGLMQLMPSTAAGAGVDAFVPSEAITAAAKILHSDMNQFGGSVPLALAAYNAGAGAVHQYGGIPPYSETQNYVRSITAMMQAGG